MKTSTLLAFGLGLLLPAHPTLSAQPVPHHFSSITVSLDQTATLSLDGSVAGMFNLTGTISNQFMQMFDLYPVEASTSLTEWTCLALLLRTNNDPNPLHFDDTNAAALSQRFYRIPTNHLLTASPKPSGPFAVGRVDRVMLDPARTNLYRYSPRTNAFMATFWYPADSPPAGALPATTYGQRFAGDANFEAASVAGGFAGADTRWALIKPKLKSCCLLSVPLATGTARFPVVLFSHGLGGTRQTSSHRAEELASHGYVVVTIDHSDCWASEFPDGRYLAGNPYSGDVSGRLKDMAFLLDELARLDSGDTLFAGRLDLERIGVSGASMGGMVVETCRSDSRVKCAAIWDGTNLQLNGAGLQKPFLIGLGQSNLFYSEAQWLFGKAATNAVLLLLRNADHATETDAAWSWEVPWGRGPALAFDACVVWFFGTYLKGEAPPFPTNPEIYNVQRK
jgi:dienelactone hydrolase